jgi:hypothetical protein
MSAPEFIAPTAHQPITGVADTLAQLDDDPGERCRVGKWEDALTHEDAESLRAHVVPGRVRPVFDLLRHDGHKLPFSATSWERHFTGRCPCDTGAGRAAA